MGSLTSAAVCHRMVARLLALGAAGALVVTLMPGAAIAAPEQPNAAPAQPNAAPAQPALASGDWPQFHNGPTHQGYNAAENTLSTSNVGALEVAWTGTTGASIWSSPAVANGVVYVGSFDGKLYAYAVNCAIGSVSCSPLWTAATGAATGGIWSSPAVANGVVYVGSGDGKLYAFDAAGVTGCSGSPKVCTPLWTSVATGDTISSSPAVVNGVVYVGSNDAKLYAFDAAGVTGCGGSPKTCNPLWTGAGGGVFDTSAPAVANGVVYVGSGDHKLYAFDAAGVTGCGGSPRTCTPLWTAATGGGIYSSSAVANGVVYVGSIDGKLYAFDAAGVTGCSGSPKTCNPLWTAATGGAIDTSSPAVANGVVYVGSTDHKLYSFDAAGITGCSGSPKTCNPLWTAATGGAVQSSPAVANGVVYVGSFDYKLYAFDAAGVTGCSGSPKTCNPLWTGATGGVIRSSPAVANGVVYVGSYDGKLYAFAINGDWPQFHKGPSHEGYNTQEHVLSPSNVGALGVAWTATAGDIVGSSPAVANGVVYVGSDDDKLYAYAVGCASGGGTCSPLWTSVATGGNTFSSPAVANGVVYVGSEDGKLYAFDAAGVSGCSGSPKTCSPLWSATTGGAIWSSPAVANGVVYVGSTDNKLYAFDAAGVTGCSGSPKTCSPVWSATTGGAIQFSSPAVGNGVVYVGSMDGKLYAYRVGCASGGGSCSPLWTGATGGQVYSSPAVANGVVYVGSTDGKLYAYAAWCNAGGGTCTPLWTGATGGGIFSSPAVANGVVYVGSGDHKLYAFSVAGVVRYSGAGRFATAADVSAHTFPDNCGCVAYIAYAYNFPDALAGAAAAGTVKGPVLLVNTTGPIDSYTAAELTRLAPTKIIVLGSTGVISAAVATALIPYASGEGSVVRYSGAGRFATAADVSLHTFPMFFAAASANSLGGTCMCVAYIAYAYNFPDALAGAAAAGTVKGPVLLVNTTGPIDSYTAAELTRLAPTKIVVLGSTGVISAAVATALVPYAGSGGVVRYSGAGRFATAASVSANTFAADCHCVAYIAYAYNFPDALAGAAAAGTVKGPVLLVNTTGTIDSYTAAELTRLKPVKIIVLGSAGVISDGVLNSLKAYLAP